MSCLTTWTPETQEDCVDLSRMVSVISEIDQKLDDLIARITALEGQVVSLGVTVYDMEARIAALEAP